MKLIFAGTPEFAAIILNALLKADHEIVAVYTQPDRPAGRGRKLSPGPVKRLAQAADLLIRQPTQLRSRAAVDALLALQADAMVVAAYGLMLPTAVLDGPLHGCINVHASLLPRWRGASPIQHALLAADAQTGISIMQMDAGLDTGPVLRECPLTIHSGETAGSLHDRLAVLGAQCLPGTLEVIDKGQAVAQAQNPAQACYAPRLSKAQARIDWQQDAQVIERMVRAFNPWPVAHTQLPALESKSGHRQAMAIGLRVHAAEVFASDHAATPGEILQANRDTLVVACGSQALKLLEVQVAGKRRLAVPEFLKARPLQPGQRLL